MTKGWPIILVTLLLCFCGCDALRPPSTVTLNFVSSTGQSDHRVAEDILIAELTNNGFRAVTNGPIQKADGGKKAYLFSGPGYSAKVYLSDENLKLVCQDYEFAEWIWAGQNPELKKLCKQVGKKLSEKFGKDNVKVN